ncbi:MAG: hypothetical protein MR006_07560 [Arcanobacterium sp.]|nr:hypothetical protein [Arcanobacterium sp.]
MWVQVDFDERGNKAIFRRFSAQAETIRAAVTAQLETQISADFSKTKLASRHLFAGLRVYECRVNMGKLPALRVAFTVRGNQATVVYMSTHIQKSDFSREVDAFLK